MKKIWIPLLLAAAAFSGSALAHPEWDDGYRPYVRHHHREVVRYETYYNPPVVVYSAPPVLVRERIEYRERPVYYAQPYPQPTGYYAPPPRSDGNRFIGQAMGAIAGGVIGSNIGQGNGRIAATAIGAALGSVVGGDLSGYR
ncbi:hypothetical protein DLREEDagrD3_18700 [Denitratisoma sp. agr-D3]